MQAIQVVMDISAVRRLYMRTEREYASACSITEHCVRESVRVQWQARCEEIAALLACLEERMGVPAQKRRYVLTVDRR